MDDETLDFCSVLVWSEHNWLICIIFSSVGLRKSLDKVKSEEQVFDASGSTQGR